MAGARLFVRGRAILRPDTRELMPVDPQVQYILDKMAAAPDIHTLSVAQARAAHIWKFPKSLRIDPIASTRDCVIPGAQAPKARVYRPLGSGPFPMLVFFHGSGFVVCNLDTHDAMCRNLCSGSGCVVLSVDYRLAPEAKFPAAVDDCFEACKWAAANAPSLGCIPGLIMVGGDSAGGNLAAVTAIQVRDQGGPALCGQMLIYPVTDYHSPGTPSYAENAVGYGLTRQTMEWFWSHYLNHPDEAANPLAAPLRTPRLDHLPSALVLTAQYDPLRDEGERYAERLAQAGVEVERKRYDGMHHGFFFFPGVIGKADEALDQTCAWIRRRFSAAPTKS